MIADEGEPVPGGTALNAALAFQKWSSFKPVVLGKVGADVPGRLITETLEQNGIISLVSISQTRPTGSCTLVYHDNLRLLLKDDGGANDYDLDNLKRTSRLGFFMSSNDIIFMAGHFLTRCSITHSQKMIETAAAMGAPIILDLVPHNLYEKISIDDLALIIKDYCTVIIAEYRTFMALLKAPIHTNNGEDEPTTEDVSLIFSHLNVKKIVLRYGTGNIAKQMVCSYNQDGITIEEKIETGYENIKPFERSGFGDKLTANLLDKITRATGLCSPIDSLPGRERFVNIFQNYLTQP
jgi:sugar/nucleoside kinase (ribokinase family)